MTILISVFLGIILLRLAMIDRHSFRLPDVYTLPLIVAGIIVNSVLASAVPHQAIWGAVVGFTVFWLIGTLFHRRTGQEGLGLGDAKLLSAAGAWVGLYNLPAVILMAAGGGLVHTMIKGLGSRDPIAFGPWLAASFWLVWVMIA